MTIHFAYMDEYKPILTEDFLQYIWRTQKYDHENLFCTTGESLDVLQPGTMNRDQGPDFIDSRLRIGGQLWAGMVEVHVRSSDWKKHGHQDNPDYLNVILHVVYEDDEPVMDPYGEKVPTLILKERIDHSILETYRHLSSYDYEMIPCEKLIHTVSRLNITSWKERMAVERLEERQEQIEDIFNFSNKSFQETLFKLLFRAFGFSKNSTAFEWLANTLQFKIVGKYLDQKLKLESLLYGQAGMLTPELKDEYPQKLRAEYEFLAEKYQLEPIDRAVWNYARMRPQNFPTIRISQLADFLHRHGETLMYSLDWLELIDQMECAASPYWNDHYRFDVKSRQVREKKLGKNSRDLIFINVLVPFLFFVGHKKNDNEIKSKALTILENLSAESNRIIRIWDKLDVKSEHALDSQALLYLYRSYCMERKCAQCRIGQAILLKS